MCLTNIIKASSIVYQLVVHGRFSCTVYSVVAGPSKACVSAACLLGLRVRIPPGTWMSLASVVFCQVEVCSTG